MAGAFDQFPTVAPEAAPGGAFDATGMSWADLSPMDRARIASEKARATGPSFLAGLLGMGGATAPMMRRAGYEGAADWLDSRSAENPDVSMWGTLGSGPLALVGPVSEAAGAFRDLATKPVPDSTAPQQRIMTRDEFMQERRPAQVPLSEFVAKAQADYQNSPAYMAMIKDNNFKASRKNLADIAAQAEATWRANQREAGTSQAKLDADYEAYLTGEDRRLRAENAQSFAARNPELAKIGAVAGPLAAAVLTRGMFNKIAKRGQGFVDEAAGALENGQALKFGLNAANAKKWAGHVPWKQGAAIGAASTIPLDIRGMGDAVDKYGLPTHYVDAHGEMQPVIAQQDASERLSDPIHYLKDGIPAIVSGLTGSIIGSKFAKAAPRAEAGTLGNADEIAQSIGAFSKIKGAEASALGAPASLSSAGAFGSGRPLSPPPLPASVSVSKPTQVNSATIISPKAMNKRIDREVPKVLAEDALSVFKTANPKATAAQLRAQQKAFLEAAKKNPSATVDEIAKGALVPIKGPGKAKTSYKRIPKGAND